MKWDMNRFMKNIAHGVNAPCKKGKRKMQRIINLIYPTIKKSSMNSDGSLNIEFNNREFVVRKIEIKNCNETILSMWRDISFIDALVEIKKREFVVTAGFDAEEKIIQYYFKEIKQNRCIEINLGNVGEELKKQTQYLRKYFEEQNQYRLLFLLNDIRESYN